MDHHQTNATNSSTLKSYSDFEKAKKQRLYIAQLLKSLKRAEDDNKRLRSLIPNYSSTPGPFKSLTLEDVEFLQKQLSTDPVQNFAEGKYSALFNRHAPPTDEDGNGESTVFLASDILFELMLHVNAVDLLSSVQLVSKEFYHAVQDILYADVTPFPQALEQGKCNSYSEYMQHKERIDRYWKGACEDLGVTHGGTQFKRCFLKSYHARKINKEKNLKCSVCMKWFSLDDIMYKGADICELFQLGHDFTETIERMRQANGKVVQISKDTGIPIPPPASGLLLGHYKPPPSQTTNFPPAIPPPRLLSYMAGAGIVTHEQAVRQLAPPPPPPLPFTMGVVPPPSPPPAPQSTAISVVDLLDQKFTNVLDHEHSEDSDSEFEDDWDNTTRAPQNPPPSARPPRMEDFLTVLR